MSIVDATKSATAGHAPSADRTSPTPGDGGRETLLACEDILVTREGATLRLATSGLSRTLDLSGGVPRTVALADRNGRAYADAAKAGSDFSFIGLTRPGMAGAHYLLKSLTAEWVEASPFDGAHARVTLAMAETVQEAEFRREYFLYPGLAALSVRTAVRTPVMPNIYWSRRGDLAGAEGNLRNGPPERLESCADGLRAAAGLAPRRAVEFLGRTDYHDERAIERKAADERLSGNLLYIDDGVGAGFLYLQEAPPSGERRDFEPYDFRWSGGEVHSCTWGVFPSELRPGIWFQGYRHTLVLHRDAEERDRLLKEYLRRRFPEPPGSARTILVNPWGCACFPKIVSEEFLKEELRACPAVGATHYQIDDAWQQGLGLRELFVHNRHIKPDFWDVSRTRLGGTLRPLREAADAAGIDLGLWLAPSANCEYRDWPAFVDIVMGMYREYGIKVFKIDAVMLRTSESESNLAALLRTCRERSRGAIYFNLDTTNGQRPGYFQFLDYGNIFLANRYVCNPGSIGYHPEKTLRSLWTLARYTRTQTLQVEIPSPEDILPSCYADKGWTDLSHYPAEYWAAIPLLASPLLWFAPSRQSPGLRRRIKSVMDLRTRYADWIAAGEVYPVGERPDGRSVAGFRLDDPARRRGLVLLFREWGAAAAGTAEFKTAGGAREFDVVAGQGTIRSEGGGAVAFIIERPASFLLAEYRDTTA